jgi:hypothetical protein
MSGTWQRVNANSGGLTARFQNKSAAIIHTITMDPPFYTTIRIQVY